MAKTPCTEEKNAKPNDTLAKEICGDVLEIEVDVGFFTKDVEWQRQIITNKN